MTIVVSDNAVLMLVFIAGLIIGAIAYRIITAPIKPAKPIDYYDGTHGMGYQPLPESNKAPPKPLHNPHK